MESFTAQNSCRQNVASGRAWIETNPGPAIPNGNR
jgi:hypothetical protein